ncbi:hypothetical protein EUTSA_v10007813mg [Eutrema salsugineum]|uniref:Plastid transcriptionally active 6 n=1 Tax=Eutrema salsugineum TaxID=72664 RepID=V4L4F7_EUTSA|nr:hypothetical protein EUTSA_v10007813mg [Eutrema salsugineum]
MSFFPDTYVVSPGQSSNLSNFRPRAVKIFSDAFDDLPPIEHPLISFTSYINCRSLRDTLEKSFIPFPMASSAAAPSLSLLSFTSKPPPSSSAATTQRLFPSFRTDGGFAPLKLKSRRGRSIIVKVDDVDADGGGPDEYDMDDEEVEEVDNKKDYDVEYDPLAAAMAAASGGGDGDIAFVQSKSFISTQGWDSDMVVDYRINEDEFHKISLLDCDFFIRKPPDPDNDVYDFREMYVTPPDTDVYSIPRVLAPMPQKYIRCAMSDYGCYNVTEPPIDAPRDPLYKSEREISKVFLTKHYRNRRSNDPEFVLDLEEIYVIDSKTKSITRARVLFREEEKGIGRTTCL